MEDSLQIGDIVEVIDLKAKGKIIKIDDKGSYKLYKVIFNGTQHYIPAYYKSTELKFIERIVEEEN